MLAIACLAAAHTGFFEVRRTKEVEITGWSGHILSRRARLGLLGRRLVGEDAEQLIGLGTEAGALVSD